jgi:hypothetical protein
MSVVGIFLLSGNLLLHIGKACLHNSPLLPLVYHCIEYNRENHISHLWIFMSLYLCYE